VEKYTRSFFIIKSCGFREALFQAQKMKRVFPKLKFSEKINAFENIMALKDGFPFTLFILL